jgi:tRNA pseudouridine32 synthase/23S rRNA pseudouridine746 synthase
MLSVPGLKDKDSLATRVAKTFNIARIDQMIIHRLDYATSGVLLFARNEIALRLMHDQFRRKGNVYKKYVALVSGIPHAISGEIDLPLARDPIRGPPFNQVDPIHGKESLTYWNLRRIVKQNASLIDLTPITGRTHQLRIHLNSVGHPIIGDRFYANKEVAELSTRLCLHAESLAIFHPRSGKPIRFFASCPFDGV